mmetsp:Transcript_9560/g.20979  ORF Transcript_9560/g.20979 Transcript_9560/m.20979 type:complete len:188 (+) Transcript_9560:339-902(+)
MPAAAAQVEGRIPGFDIKWNKTLCDVIGKEDKSRWNMQDKMAALHRTNGVERKRVKLPRAHSCIGPFPGCRTLQVLSPRKSASVAFLEQRLQRSSHVDPLNPTVRERLYEGVSREGQGRAGYLRRRSDVPPPKRYGSTPATSAQEIGWSRPEYEYRASKFSHHPVMEVGFYRNTGVATHMDLPAASK